MYTGAEYDGKISSHFSEGSRLLIVINKRVDFKQI